MRFPRAAIVLFCFAIVTTHVHLAAEDEKPTAPEADTVAGQDQSHDHASETIRGRIVWMADALSRRFNIETVPEAQDRIIALETKDGQLYPIVEDARGRAFRRDERLRNLEDCELLVRRHEGSPMVQMIRLFSYEDGKRFELDYWCEICAIAMYELKKCECCQGEIELRRRRPAEE